MVSHPASVPSPGTSKYENLYNNLGSLDVSIDPSMFPETPESAINTIARLVKESQLYKQAYDVFSSDARYGNPYLVQLELIPYSNNVADENFWDGFSELIGSTSKFEKAVVDAFNIAMDEIRQLVLNYYSFINSLPETQIQQQKDAGFNAAVTGQGITGSEMSTDGAVLENPSQSSYSNDQLSQGITSFVEFAGLVGSLVSGGISSASVMSMLDLAEREGYNKQEVHDLLMANQGVTVSSPYRVLSGSSDSAVSDVAKVASANARSVARALDNNHTVRVGGSSDMDPSSTVIMSGMDVLNEVASFSLINRLGNQYIDMINNGITQQYASAVGNLEQQFKLSSSGRGIAENTFMQDYYQSRNGVLEGQSQTSVAQSLSSIRASEAEIQSFSEWLADYKYQTMSSWAEQIADRPELTPFFYKALFDFDMSDSFYHMNKFNQGLKYGLETLNSGSEVFSNCIGGFFKAFRKKRSKAKK